MKNSKIFLILFIPILFLAVSCEEIYTPKPHGYLRIDFPEKKYRKFDNNYPYKFDYPIYAQVKDDKTKGAEKYWSNINFPAFKATINVTYKDITNNFSVFEDDTRKMAYKHTIKADAINEKVWINTEKKVYGIMYEIKGNTASSVQFYLTDSVKHFFRAALYFNVQPNKDSLRPSLKFIKQDIDTLINTFEWN